MSGQAQHQCDGGLRDVCSTAVSALPPDPDLLFVQNFSMSCPQSHSRLFLSCPQLLGGSHKVHKQLSISCPSGVAVTQPIRNFSCRGLRAAHPQFLGVFQSLSK